jgi:hypothetical protein
MTIQRLPMMCALGAMVYATSSAASIEHQAEINVQTQNSMPLVSVRSFEEDVAWVEFAAKAMPGRPLDAEEQKITSDIFWSMFG